MNVHDDFEIMIACSKKPDNFDEMQELQELAAENYKQELEDLESRYEGLTPYQKKQCILQELEDAQNPRKSSARGSARPKWSRAESSAKKPQPVSDTPNKIDRRSIINNDIVIKMPPKKANAQRPAWDDSTEPKIDAP